MLLVKTRLQQSPLHGTGLYAAESIAAGATVWRFVSGLDQRIPAALVRTWPPQAQVMLEHYAGELRGEFWLDGDDARFMNHSDVPNVVVTDDEVMVAARSITSGEELCCDYRSFDDPCRKTPALIQEE